MGDGVLLCARHPLPLLAHTRARIHVKCRSDVASYTPFHLPANNHVDCFLYSCDLSHFPTRISTGCGQKAPYFVENVQKSVKIIRFF